MTYTRTHRRWPSTRVLWAHRTCSNWPRCRQRRPHTSVDSDNARQLIQRTISAHREAVSSLARTVDPRRLQPVDVERVARPPFVDPPKWSPSKRPGIRDAAKAVARFQCAADPACGRSDCECTEFARGRAAKLVSCGERRQGLGGGVLRAPAQLGL